VDEQLTPVPGTVLVSVHAHVETQCVCGILGAMFVEETMHVAEQLPRAVMTCMPGITWVVIEDCVLSALRTGDRDDYSLVDSATTEAVYQIVFVVVVADDRVDVRAVNAFLEFLQGSEAPSHVTEVDQDVLRTDFVVDVLDQRVVVVLQRRRADPEIDAFFDELFLARREPRALAVSDDVTVTVVSVRCDEHSLV
jgi:hypothetical protein